MKIPVYERQIVNKAAPKVAPTPVFEAQRSSIATKQKVYGLKSNVQKLGVSKDFNDKQYDIQSQGLDLQQQNIDMQKEKWGWDLGLNIARLTLDAAKTGYQLYTASMDAETSKAIESYEQEKALYDAALARNNYTMGDVADIDAQWQALQDSNVEWKSDTIEKVLSGTRS